MNPASFSLPERTDKVHGAGRRRGAEESNHRRRRLLCPRRERPSRCSAEQRYEFAPLHCLMLPVLSTERIAHVAMAQT